MAEKLRKSIDNIATADVVLAAEEDDNRLRVDALQLLIETAVEATTMSGRDKHVYHLLATDISKLIQDGKLKSRHFGAITFLGNERSLR